MPRITKYEAPASYDELFTVYFGYIEAMLVKAGIQQHRVPDEAMNIIASLIKVDFLASYDGSKMWRIGTVHGKKITLKQGEPEPEGFILTGERTAPFMSPFRTYVGLTIRAARDRQARDMDRLVQFGDEETQTALLENRLQKMAVDPHEVLDIESSIKVSLNEMHEAFKRECINNPQAIDLSALALSLRDLTEENDGKLPKDYLDVLTAKFNVNVKIIKEKIQELRQWLSDDGFRPSVKLAA